ncbi:MAG: alpha/beta hydrolase [Clostridium sp.]|nr:alpha/beta hydrolase [Clostridium sp.]
MENTITKSKTKKKRTGLKVLLIAIGIILIIAIAATIFVNIITKPRKDQEENLAAVGGMIYSDTIEYKNQSSGKLDKNLIIKYMQMAWYFCDNSNNTTQSPTETDAIKDIPYIDDGNIYHKLDVFYPQNTTLDTKLPVIIDIHGGGWMCGTKDANDHYCRALADRGFTVFSISYRLVPDVTVNEQLQDCMTALKWISDNMGNYPCDATNIMLTGDSAGGQLSLYSAVLMQSAELRETFNVDNVNLDIDALLLTSPVPYMKSGGPLSIYTKILWGENYKEKNTYNFMDIDEIIDYAQLPPTYLITSSGDFLANTQTHKTAELLESKGTKTVIKDYDEVNGKKLPHVFSVLSPFDDISIETLDEATAFYNKIIAEQK